MDKTIIENTETENIREVFIVSSITPEDVETVLNMAAASGLFHSDAMLAAEHMAWDSAYGDGGEDHTFLLAKAQVMGSDKTIGFLCFGPILHWPNNYELFGIAVSPEYQRLGIGSGLVAEMKRHIAGKAGQRIFLETGNGSSFEGARLFYEANDFIYEHRFHKNFIPLEGDAVYRLDVSAEETDQHYQ